MPSFIRGETLARGLEVAARAPAPDLEQRVEHGWKRGGGGSTTISGRSDFSRPSTMDE